VTQRREAKMQDAGAAETLKEVISRPQYKNIALGLRY